MADKLAIIDSLIERLQVQLRGLNQRHNELLDAMTADPASLDSSAKGSPGVELMENRTKAGAIEHQLASFRERRVEAEDEQRESVAASRRAQFKGDTVAKCEEVHTLTRQRVAIGRAMDKAFKTIGAALAELESIDAKIVGHVTTVVRVAYMGTPNENHRVGDNIAAARSGLIEGAAPNALVHQLLSNGVGRQGIAVPMLFGNPGTVRAESLEQAFAKAATRAEALTAGWLHRAFGASSAEPDQVVRVRATEDGYDGIGVRTVGEVFDYTLKAGHELPRWVEGAAGAQITKPAPKHLSGDELAAMNPGNKVVVHGRAFQALKVTDEDATQ